MPGEDVHVAVAHKKGSGGVCAQLGHQGEQPGGVGLGRYARAVAPHGGKAAGAKVVGNDAAAQGISLVGEYRALDALGLQCVQQCRNAGVGRGLVLLVGIVPGGELRQRRRQLRQGFFQGGLVPGPLRGKALHQLGDAVAHHQFELCHRKGGPAVLGTHPVAGIGKVVDGVQQGAVQIK